MTLALAVTGQHGQVARSLAERAAAQGMRVILLGRPALDLLVPETIGPALAASGADVIVNAAAYTAVDQAESEADVALAVNGHAPGHIAAAAAQMGVPLIHLSTDYVFDGAADRPYREDDAVAPMSAYGRSKLAGEQAVAAATANHAILRTSWVYSPFGRNFVRTMLMLGQTRDHVRVVADQHGNPTSALDLADAIIAMAGRLAASPAPDLRGTFHGAGSGDAVWADVAEAIFAEAVRHGRAPVRVERIATAEFPTPARRPANSRLDCRRLAAAYGLTMPLWRGAVAACVTRLLETEREDTGQ